MISKSLSDSALNTIYNYLHLPLTDKTTLAAPYYNNRRQKVRAGLRVLIGKGSVNDIVQEVQLAALRSKVDLDKISNHDLKEFLVNHNIGIDCSGLVYHVLDKEMKEHNGRHIKSVLRFPHIKNQFRKLLTKFRPAENVSVKVLAHNANSKPIALKKIAPGDLILLLNFGPEHDRYHVLLVHQVDYSDKQISKIHYTHSFQWSTDGKYNHGVRQGTITITDSSKPLLDQTWEEQKQIGNKNETFTRAKSAKKLLLNRLNAFS